MLWHKPQGGFTLVEIVMVTAISGALMAIFIQGYRGVIARSRFSSAIETAKQTMVGVKNEANTTVNIGSLKGTDNNVIVGKMARFSKNSNVITVWSLVGDVAGISNLEQKDQYTVSLPYGVYFNPPSGTNGYVVFYRSATDGRLSVFTPAIDASVNNCSGGTPGLLCNRTYILPQNPTTGIYPFSDPNGYTAQININASTGAITRTIN